MSVVTWGFGPSGGGDESPTLTNVAQGASSLAAVDAGTADVALFWDAVSFAADMGVVLNDLAVDPGLETAVMLSLFTDRRAEDGDTLDSGESDRRGWWADEFNEVAGDRTGSRLWRLRRSKRTQEVLTLAEQYTREALAWLLEDKVADHLEVTASFVGEEGWQLDILVFRPKADPAKFRYSQTWTAQEAAGTDS